MLDYNVKAREEKINFGDEIKELRAEFKKY